MQTELNVMLRTEKGKKSIVRNLRTEGFVPAICYGAIKESIAVYVSAKELKSALSTDAKEHVLINLKTDKKSELDKKVALLKSIDKHPLKRTYVHADFLVLDMTKPITVTIEVKLFGKAKGLISGGMLDQVKRTIEVNCLPSNIPNHIDVDISHLDLGDSLHVRDIPAPEGVKIVTGGELTIATVSVPIVAKSKEETAAEAVAAEEAAAPAAGKPAVAGKPAAATPSKDDKDKGKDKK